MKNVKVCQVFRLTVLQFGNAKSSSKGLMTVFSGFFNRIADKLRKLTVKSQEVYFFAYSVQLHCIWSVWSKGKTTYCAGAQVKLV